MGTTQESGYHRANMQRHARYTAVFAVLIAAFLGIIVLNINTGNVKISLGNILRILFLRQGTKDEINIVWKIRLPRMLMAAMLGGALSISGFLLQTFFENPIAGPFVLGISSGAKMVVALVMIVFLNRFENISSYGLIAAAFGGSMIVTGFILLCSRYVRNMAGLLVSGIMVGYICSAITDFLITFADDTNIVNLQGWSMGSFSGMNWSNVRVAFAVLAVCMALVMILSKPIGAFQLGESYARSMGVNVKLFRVLLILLSSILSATVTAFAGPISFVGIAVPFLIKQALRTSRPLVVIPAAFLGGAVFCMFCDLIARMAFAPTELKISTVTSMFGAPIVIYMLIRSQQKKK